MNIRIGIGNSWRQELEQRLAEAESYYLLGSELLFGVMKIFWIKIVVMVTQNCQCT